MKTKPIVLRKRDYEYLTGILKVNGLENNQETRNSLKKLATELKVASLVEDEDLPAHIIAFNSKVTLAIDEKEVVVELVKPAAKDWKNGKISILTPMGLALIGYGEGDIVKWQFPRGEKEIKILAVSQAKENLTHVHLQN